MGLFPPPFFKNDGGERTASLLNRIVLDAWTTLSHKAAMGNRSIPTGWHSAPSWVGQHNMRRLQAYRILTAYQSNAARAFLALGEDGDVSAIDDHREYGDAALVVAQTLAALIGDDQSITVEDAGDYDPDLDPAKADPEDVLANAEAGLALERQEMLQAWATDERLALKVIETERDAIGLGDGVYTLGWSSRHARPRLRIYDPGFYFPVLDDGPEDDYPATVHIAWELVPELFGEVSPVSGGKAGEAQGANAAPKRRVRRITYRLEPIRPLGTNPDGTPILDEGDAYDEATGKISRSYPWNDDPAEVSCYMSDAVWTIDGLKGTVEDFSEAKADWQLNEDGEPIRNLDLRIDFVPVVHIPNTVALKDHFGRSTLGTVLQLIDDLQAADTDLSKASSTTGFPPIALSGARLARATPGGDNYGAQVAQPLTYGPGTVFETGDGNMTVLDTSASLSAITAYIAQLLDRLSVNARLPAALLGRLKPSEVPSGIALALSFGPLQSMVREMRQVRGEKYPLLLKFVQRFFQAFGELPEGRSEVLPATLSFGSFLPDDRAGTVSEVASLLGAKAISLKTAIQLLIEAGFPIDDAAAEVDRIQAEDFEAAAAMLEATGNTEAVSARLGVPAGGPPQPPAPGPELRYGPPSVPPAPPPPPSPPPQVTP